MAGPILTTRCPDDQPYVIRTRFPFEAGWPEARDIPTLWENFSDAVSAALMIRAANRQRFGIRVERGIGRGPFSMVVFSIDDDPTGIYLGAQGKIIDLPETPT